MKEQPSFRGFGSYKEWQSELNAEREKYDSRWRFEQAFKLLSADDKWLGWCAICERQTNFKLPSIALGTEPNLREELICEQCGMNARVRAALHIARSSIDLKRARLYITEQASPTYVWLQRNLGDVVGSEYVQVESTRRAMNQYLADLGGVGKIRFEDVTSLSFEKSRLHAIASFDVLEHVPNYPKALQEFARTLRPGGVLVLTAPFVNNNEHTIIRARMDESGTIEHLMEPEFHGDPAGGGILCYYHFGWDLLEVVRAAGFSEARMVLSWSPGMGFMGSLWTLVATR